ncbi:MAG: inositol monophosphatase family protein [Acidobacteriota bacterium]
MDWQDVEKEARSVILKVGEMIREQIGTIDASTVGIKGPHDFVTHIDIRSEELFMEMIRSRFPDHHIMSEETANEGLQEGITWVIDPLDGTTNFIHGFPFVAVSVAVCDNKKPVLGFVLDPVRQELFSARKGAGAYLNGKRIQVRSGARLDDALIATGFPLRSRGVFEPYLNVFRSVFHHTSGIRRAGAAALDLAYLAAGRVDGFWEVGLRAWDVAAGSLLTLEAGGQVSDFWGKDDYLVNGHIVGGTAAVYPFLLEQVEEHLAPVLEPGKVMP